MNATTRRLGITLAGVLLGFALVGALLAACMANSRHTASGPSAPGTASATATSTLPPIPEPKVSDAVKAKLPRATTSGKVPTAPIDLTTGSGGKVIKVGTDQVGFARPGSTPITFIPASQFGSALWLPVITSERGWAQVRLPSRPNGSTAWIPEADRSVAVTAWRVSISLSKDTLTIYQGQKQTGEWPIGKGKKGTPTPVGQTFLLAGFVDPTQKFSPVIYATGAHSDTLDTFGGGPGTVAVHGWPTAVGRTGEVSHGCVRVPAEALTAFGKLPAGTPIDISR
ncbi:L,D-transpeptidase family protein [Calidifontibacter sp. DB0510]|uniref:L,D-transpeptidase family protein n=1 Tax=Metallococcus carri TaxID=1656884 RepID=A0A967B4S2_9MICO|nr:L,D-transpeptidase [Metallococcus carri]NHN57265.1 L,D-transpeptidase family protein [Metallococcus carri]NOP37932.1 L,D-transpeptidase family protein [Calidifontibacter sp. DB2511S]